MKSALTLSLAAVASASSFSVGTVHDKAAPILSSIDAETIPDSYIIKFKDHVDHAAASDHHMWVQDTHKQGETERLELRKRSIPFTDKTFSGLKHTFDIGDAFKGYAGHFDESMIEKVRNHPDVEFIERDTLVHTMVPVSQNMITEDKCDGETERQAPWGLARISHRNTLNFGTFNKYLYSSDGGEGVDAYIVDTGTNIDHVDFEGRAHWGKTIPSGDADEDGNGHGTHCSGTVAGKKYGVAKKANVYAVKVLRSNGSGSMSDVVKGVEFAATSHLEQKKKAKDGKRKGFKGSVANMSLGGGKTQALDAAVNAAVRTGIHFAVAAGNDNADACNYSPAAASEPVTVGASALDDSRAYFSNYGKCTDIFAPGLNIQSTWIGSKYAVNTISGTSMASPHIAGLLAYYLSLQPAEDSEYALASITPKKLKENLISVATEDALSDIPSDTPNLLAWNGGGCSDYKKIVEAGSYKVKAAPSSRVEEIKHAVEQEVNLVSGKLTTGAKELGSKAEKFSKKIHELVDEELEQFLKELNLSRKKNRRPLSRSKSTNSVARSPIHDLESINPARAERDANIAAVVSYQRAQDRDSSEGMLFPWDPASFYPDRSDSTGSVIRHSLERTDSALSGHGSSNIARQTSVRFTGPLAHPRRNFAPRANGGRDSPTKATSTIHAFGNANARPSSTLSFQDERPDNFSLTRRYLETLQPPDSCYHPEEDAASMAVTYKKVRKSRSMVTSSHAETGTISSKTWSARTRQPPTVPRRLPTNSENEQLKAAVPPNATLRASTSMGFLKTRRRLAASRSSSHADDHDLAVQLARERFRQIQEQDAKKSQPSSLLRPKHTQSENSPLRKSMRNSSNNTAVSALSTISASKQRGIRKTARKVSHGLRSRLRGLFGRGKSSEDSDQHEHEQVAVDKDSDAESCLHIGDAEPTEEASMFQVTSHVPSLHDVPSNQQLRSRKGSVESFGDGDQHIPDDKSRVTSWTNSMTNTVTSHGTLGDWERQRLSVIKENGTHIPSSARSIEYLEQQTRDMIADMSIDSERVYSALMERLARKEPTDRVLQSQPGSVKSRATNTGDSDGQSINGQWDCSTIRCVRPDDNIFRDSKDHSSRSSSSATEVPEHENRHQPQAGHTSTGEHTDALDWSDDRTHSESERTSVLLQGLEPHRTITQRSSAFFASPSCQSFCSPSPYRRALRASQMNSEDEPDAFQGSRYLHSLSTLCLPTRQDSSPSSGKDLQVGDAESVYSCAGDDANLVHSASENTAGQNETCSYNDPVPPPDVPARRSYRQHQRDTSTASSVEWKTWLSSKVSQLEAPLTPSKREKWNDVLPTLGHVRENASIGSTPEHFIPAKDGATNRSPLSNVKGNAQTFQGAGSPTRPTRQVLIGYDENAAPSYKANTYTKERPPSIPPRSTLRAVPSLPSVGSKGYNPDTGLVKEMPRMRSLNTIGRLNSTLEESINKRRSRTRVTGWQGSPTKSSPGVRAQLPRTGSPALRGDFGLKYPIRSQTTERQPRDRMRDRESDAQAMGSKTMVDLFLSSRRNQGDGRSSGFGSSPAAFL
ncbi:subtilisin-like serine protease [Fusarium mundagurra]|uniref:Subtilisin-like serine protease n=1 Tax=Fusarium mundagurra TaxID=1567541 RepID=A0A8H5YNT7_9HYPO|nr:subtilisin-like serine protease [Fusarium mundagurra]